MFNLQLIFPALLGDQGETCKECSGIHGPPGPPGPKGRQGEIIFQAIDI